jgi:hypothetical protein
VVLKEGPTSTLSRKAKHETVTFHAHRFLCPDRMACANKIKIGVVNITSKGVAHSILIRSTKSAPVSEH